jgi:hypothetical protein
MWPAPSTDEPRRLNISCFVFRDVNRNGLYDIADRPQAGLRVHLTGPKKSTEAESNVAGFANFPMSLGNRKQPIDRPGRYAVRAVAPRNYAISTGNAEQTLAFREQQGSPAGLVVEGATCSSIGVVPDLNIVGFVGNAATGEQKIVSVTSADRAASVELAGNRFIAAAGEGRWSVDFQGSGTSARDIEVTHLPVYVSAPNADRDAFEPAGDEVLVDFDGFTSSDTLYEVPNGVAGLHWQNWVATHNKLYKGAGYVNTTTSSEYVGYNSSGQVTAVWSDVPFDFVGTNLGVAWPDAERADIVLRGWRGKDVVYEDRLRASTAGAVFVAADYRSITRLEMSTDTFWQFVADDMRFRVRKP